MNFCKVALSLFTVAAAAPNRPDVGVEARRRLREQMELFDEYGQFVLRYVTAEGAVVSESGRLVLTPDGTRYVMIVEGEIAYIGDDGWTYVTEYNTNGDGTHVDIVFEGRHLQVPNTTHDPDIAETIIVVSVIDEPDTTPESVAEPVENNN